MTLLGILTMKKLLLTLVLLFTSNILYAGQIKLSCNITVTEILPSGKEETKKVIEIYEVTEILDKIAIRASSGLGNLPSVTSYLKRIESISIESISNNSNESQWNITNKGTTSEGNSFDNSILIDRNTGQIFTRNAMTINGNSGVSSGTGICERIGIKKKKF